MSTIPKNLKQLRQSKSLTQEDVAERIGLTRQAISSYESGRTQPGIDLLMKFAEIYEVELDEILYGRNLQNKDQKYLNLTAKIILSLWTGFQIINIVLQFIANTFYPIIIFPENDAAKNNNDIYFQLTITGSRFDQGALNVIFFGCLILFLLNLMTRHPVTLKQKCKFLGILAIVSFLLMVISYILMPAAELWENILITIRFSWYFVIFTLMLDFIAQWIKRKVKT